MDFLEDIPFMVAVEFYLEKPCGGIRFIQKRPYDNSNQIDAYLCTVDHNPCYWFPCVNSLNEPCTWKIEVLVEKNYTVIATGNLVEVEQLAQIIQLASEYTIETIQPPSKISTHLKKYHYYMPVPTCASNVGLVIGQFELMHDDSRSQITYYFDPLLKFLVKETCSFLSELFDFYEELLSFQFPFAAYKQVFVHDLAEEFISFSTLTVIKYATFYILFKIKFNDRNLVIDF